jgi:type II restriction/modification system DNA methylase subunit YeeA
MPIDILNFVRKWNASALTERSAASQHFRDLCEALDVPHPTQSDEIGASYTYEKRVAKAGTGEQGFADVWKRGFFAWEYKSKGGDLKKAYKQLNEYHEALDNPPLLVVCDFVRFEVHTKFENLPTRIYAFNLDDLLIARDTATCALPPLEVLRHVFGDYNQLRPGAAAIRVTKAAASDLLRLAQRLELEKAATPERPSKEQIAHFLMRLVFCLFADSVGLLPNHTFRRMVTSNRHSPISFNRMLPQLFQAMSEENSFFGPDNIPFFNGGLFSDNRTIPLDHADLGVLLAASQHDWSYIEPVIFGTLFERSLDEAKRSMIGAHYTSPEDILLLIEPVVMDPLRRRWEAVKLTVLDALAEETAARDSSKVSPRLQLKRPALTLLQAWAVELTSVRVLDPACGSGNFLYIALKRLLDLWHDARVFGLSHGLTLALDPIPHPGQLFGIEIDFYAHEIASIVVWIGFLQWKHDHGVKDEREPLLRALTNIEHDNAILRYEEKGKPYEPIWPEADYIVGNPPWLGGKKIRRAFGEKVTDDLFALYKGRVGAEADLVMYWFEKARALVEARSVDAVGLLATQSIRQGANRRVLDRIADTASIFMAWSDKEWVVDGAQVRSSLIAFDSGSEPTRTLDGIPVEEIHSNLQTGANVVAAKKLRENGGIVFQGPVKVGKFEIPHTSVAFMLRQTNPNGKSNAEVIKPWINGADIVDRPLKRGIIDFGSLTEAEAALFEAPFEHLKSKVQAVRAKNRDKQRRENWWRLGRSGGNLRKALRPLERALVTSRVSKHRFYIWCAPETVPDTRVVVFASDKDYFAGVLHSSIHHVWFMATSSRHGVGNDPTYNTKTCFDTFPFPWPPGTEPVELEDSRVKAIADAARELIRLRDAWLNPPDTQAAELKKRTLTNLYNQRPSWLDNAHRNLDEAVFAAYGWPPTLTTQEILSRLIALNHERAATQTSKKKRHAIGTPPL